MTEKNNGTVPLLIAAALIAVLAIAAIYLVDVDQTEELRLPNVDVSVDGGQMPAFDVDVADVEVGTTEADVTVPTIDVGTTEAEVTIPTIDVQPPAEDDPADNPQ